MRQAEGQLAAQAQASYERMVRDWNAASPKKNVGAPPPTPAPGAPAGSAKDQRGTTSAANRAKQHWSLKCGPEQLSACGANLPPDAGRRARHRRLAVGFIR